MMRLLFISLLMTITLPLVAQHCPWDCSGLVILDWPKDKKFKGYIVSLVDSNHQVVSNHNVYDSPASIFLIYEDLKKDLSKKFRQDWYRHDTVFHFASGSPVTLYNFCDYQQDLYVEVRSKKNAAKKSYFKLTADQKFHLHNMENWQGTTPETFDPKFKVKISL